MKNWLLSICAIVLGLGAQAQITIGVADMPVHGDTLRYSNASPTLMATFNADSGAGRTWDYSLTPTSQGLDEYKHPSEVNPLFAFTIASSGSYGCKVADSIPGIGLIASGITISDLYTFYNIFSLPSSYVAEAFGATVTGFPVGTAYDVPDLIYQFPLTYGNTDSTPFELNFGAAAFGYIKQKGYRKSHVDGWGTITTPFYTAPEPCIRVRSEIVEVDSVILDTISLGLPRTTIEYKWLVNGSHYPALYVSAFSVGGIEVPLTVKYKDYYRPELTTGAHNVQAASTQVSVYPNPATGGRLHITTPDGWKNCVVDVFDMRSAKVASYTGELDIDVSQLASGQYLLRVLSGTNVGYVPFVR